MKPKSNIVYGLFLYYPFKLISETLAFLKKKEIKVYGRENVHQGSVLAINHKFGIDWSPSGVWYLFFKTFLKTPIIKYENVTHNFVGASLKPSKPVHFLVDEMFFTDKKGKGRSSLTRLIEQIPLVPVKKAIKQATYYLNAGENVAVFDGPASHPLDATKKLAVTIALHSKKDIVPVNISVEPKTSSRLVNIINDEIKKLIIAYKEPITYEQMISMRKDKTLKEISDFVWSKVYTEYKEATEETKNKIVHGPIQFQSKVNGYNSKKPFYVVIPAKNEAHKYFSRIIRELSSMKNLEKIVVIDDGSTDDTAGLVESFNFEYDTIKLIKNEKNIGKEGSIKKGLMYLVNHKLKQDSWIALMDADGQHKVKDLKKLIYAADSSDQDKVAVFGYRRGYMPLDRKFANRLTSLLYYMLSGLSIKDPLFGQKVFSSSFAKNIADALNINGGYRVELSLLHLLYNYATIYEVPVKSIYSKKECSGKSGMGIKNIHKSLSNLLYTIYIGIKDRRTTHLKKLDNLL